MLTIPMILGLGAGGWSAPAAWLIPPATVLVFLAHYAIVPWAQRAREGKAMPPGYAARRIVWAALDLAGSGICFAGAVLVAGSDARPALLAIAGAAAVLAGVYAGAAVFGSGRAIVAEMLGMAGMSLTAPMMAAAAGRPLSRALFGSAAMALGYFLSSVAFVRSYDGLKGDRPRAMARCVAAHVAIAAGLLGAARAGILPDFWWAAFVPVVARTAWGLASPPTNLRALGLRELWVALAFTGMGTFCFFF